MGIYRDVAVNLHTEMLLKQLNDDECFGKTRLVFMVTKPLVRTIPIWSKTYYNTFNDYLVMEGLKRTLPGIKSINDGVNIYYSFYSKEQENMYGVLAIEIKTYT